MLKKFVFTFGCGQQNAGRYQIIYASDMETARMLMFDKWGEKWAFGYTEAQWQEAVNRAKIEGFPLEKPLADVIYQS